jgi:hypothetical protein
MRAAAVLGQVGRRGVSADDPCDAERPERAGRGGARHRAQQVLGRGRQEAFDHAMIASSVSSSSGTTRVRPRLALRTVTHHDIEQLLTIAQRILYRSVR